MFEKKNICVLGGVILDCFVELEKDTKRPEKAKSPETGCPLYLVKEKNYFLGGAANVANNLVHLGANAYLISAIGDDVEGNLLKEMLQKEKINIDGLFIYSNPTTFKTRFYFPNEKELRIDVDYRKKIDENLENKIIDYYKKIRPNIEVLIISDNLTGLLTKNLVREIIGLSKNKLILYDPKIDLFKGTYLIKPNLKELKFLTKMNVKAEKDIEKAAYLLMKKAKAENLLLTMGKKGMILFAKDEKIKYPPICKNALDVTGAGDTIISVLGIALASGYSLEEACELANCAAGLVIQKKYTQPIEKSELENYWKKWKRQRF